MATIVFNKVLADVKKKLEDSMFEDYGLGLPINHTPWGEHTSDPIDDIRRFAERAMGKPMLTTSDVRVTINGMPVRVSNVSTSRDDSVRGERVTIDGLLCDESRAEVKAATFAKQYGSGIGVSAEDFLSQPIGEQFTARMLGKEVNMREGTQGSYAYGVSQLAEGLKSAVDSGFITADEARTEFRANVESVARADQQARYEAERIEALERELAELRGKAAETS